MFANSRGDLGSIPGRIIPKTFKMALDTSLLNTQQYKVHIKGKVEQSRRRSCTLHLGVVAIEKGAFRSPSTMATNLYYCLLHLSLEKSTNNSVASRFFAQAPSCGLMLWIDFSENHSDFFLRISQFQVQCNWEAEHYKS